MELTSSHLHRVAATGAVALLGAMLARASAGAEGPGLLLSTYLGGSDAPAQYSGDQVGGVARDSQGFILVAGTTQSADFPVTPGAFDTEYENYAGDSPPVEGFVAKLDPTGSQLIWSTFLGGGAADRIEAITVDAEGNPIVTGRTFSADFPITVGPPPLAGQPITFVTKLDAGGASLRWSRVVGGSTGTAVTVDPVDRIVIAGYTKSGFPATSGAYDESFNGGLFDAFVLRLTAAGVVEWATYLGGESDEPPAAVGVDSQSNVIVVGTTSSASFPTTPLAYDRTLGAVDAYVSKLSASGSQLLWSTFLGGYSSDDAYALAVASDGSPTVVGNTDSPDFPTTLGAYDRTFDGFPAEDIGDAFISRLDAGGTTLQASTFLGAAPLDDGAFAVALDPSGSVVVAGQTYNESFPLAGAPFDPGFNGGQDGFVAALTPSLSGLSYSSLLGGRYRDYPTDLALDGRIPIVAGTTDSDDFPTTAGAYDLTYNGTGPYHSDGFVTKLAPLSPAAVPPAPSARVVLPRLEVRPAAGGALFLLDVGDAEGEATDLSVHAVDGTAIRRLELGVRVRRGRSEILWDGRDERGRPTDSGIYFARLRVGSRVACARALIVR